MAIVSTLFCMRCAAGRCQGVIRSVSQQRSSSQAPCSATAQARSGGGRCVQPPTPCPAPSTARTLFSCKTTDLTPSQKHLGDCNSLSPYGHTHTHLKYNTYHSRHVLGRIERAHTHTPYIQCVTTTACLGSQTACGVYRVEPAGEYMLILHLHNDGKLQQSKDYDECIQTECSATRALG
jgi:hypothetical protein